MKFSSSIKSYTIILSCLFVFASCEFKEKEKEVVVYGKDTLCECELTELQMAEKYPVTHIHDSLVLCKIGSINHKTWIDFLSGNKLHNGISVFNCKTNKTLKSKYRSTSVSYKEKSLIIYSDRNFVVYDSIHNEWVLDLVVDVYKERIHVENGKIIKSEPEIILNPPKYNQKAIDEVHRRIALKKKNPRSIYLKKYLLAAALNGDSLSREYLLRFTEFFPNDHESNHGNEEEEILKDFEAFIANGGKRTYLDLTIYSRFAPKKKI